MALLFTSLLAGFLTVLAPCILPLLPVIIGRTAEGGAKGRNPYTVILALIVSVVVFTLLLRATTALIVIPPAFWTYFSGILIALFGVFSLFPAFWTRISTALKLQRSSDELLEKANDKKGLTGDILLGASFGPVFTSCSPTYFVILATVLPRSFAAGIVYLFVYAAGLGIALLLISYLGRAFVSRLKFAANPDGWFKKGLGIIFIIVGVGIMLGWDKDIETAIVGSGYSGVLQIEERLLESIE
jgi:cytochrome c biogenesis protein CcdA